jgi:hypothetical protein
MYLHGKGRPIEILNATLSLATVGTITFRDQEVIPPSFDEERRSLLKTPLTDVTAIFGISSILLWHALLTKRTVLVKGPHIGQLLSIIRAFPLFAFHRQDWSILRPYITAHDLELKDLVITKSADEEDEKKGSSSSSSSALSTALVLGGGDGIRSGVVCGTCDEGVESLFVWDFIADIKTKKITARDATDERDDEKEQSVSGPVFEMTPFHREAGNVVKHSTSQKDLVTGLTNLTTKLTAKIDEIKKELAGKPFTPANIKPLLADSTMATCRFLCDLNRAEEPS